MQGELREAENSKGGDRDSNSTKYNNPPPDGWGDIGKLFLALLGNGGIMEVS